MKCGYCEEVSGKASEILAHQKKDKCQEDKRWGEVIRLTQEGSERAAGTLTRKILGVYEPMSEEDKEKLREYNEKNKEIIKVRRDIKNGVKAAFKET